MSGVRSQRAEEALEMNRRLAKSAYGIALPALRSRQEEINSALAGGEPEYLRQGYEWQRSGITEGLAARGGVASAQQAEASQAARSGGNFSAGLSAADIGAQLANALYGSKFAEGQASFDQSLNLMGMALGGAGTAGSGALAASQNQLNTLGFLPRYNQTYANVVGGLAGGASVYGALNNAGWFGGGGLLGNPGGTPPVGAPSYGGSGSFGI